jgi:hypothetical protein
MSYETPEVDVIGTASDLIQNFAGPRTDGDGHQLSQGAICSRIEEE